MLRPVAAVSAPTLLPSPPAQFISPKPFEFRRSTLGIPRKPFNLTHRITTCGGPGAGGSQFTADHQKHSDGDWEFGDEEIEEGDGEGSPWEGAIVYRRNASLAHLEYCTTLERLGLGKVSSEVSRNRASEMGLRAVKPLREHPDGTPVLVSVDVTRRKKKLRLDGIVRTVIALDCNRCGGPAAQSVYSDFSLLLCEEPIEEPETIHMGMIFREEKANRFGLSETKDGEDEDASIDLDDRLYFPLDEKVIDISKNIRDLIHVEITISAICDPNCKGLCLNCGTNLNISSCTCRTNRKVEEKGSGSLGDLRSRMVSK